MKDVRALHLLPNHNTSGDTLGYTHHPDFTLITLTHLITLITQLQHEWEHAGVYSTLITLITLVTLIALTLMTLIA